MDYSRIVFENPGDVSFGTAPSYAFVGIYSCGDTLVFRLPIGYPKPPNGYVAARELHITFFRLFSRFRTVARANRERLKDKAPMHEDAGPATKNGREWLASHEEGDVYYYRHLDAFDSLLESFDELMILGLERRLRLSEASPNDLKNFSRTESGRVYQDDDSFFDDLSLQPLSTIALLSSDLVGLYCFLLRDLREHVWGKEDPDPLQDDILVLAERFEEKHLWTHASCWEEAHWKETRDVLREKLETIDHITPLKDEDYYRLYEAIERYLYPPADNPSGAGVLWGIDGFWPVWEWMVLTRLALNVEYRERLQWMDVGNLPPGTVDDLKDSGFKDVDEGRALGSGNCDWKTFVENGWKIGHPYPDAILRPADLEVRWNDWFDRNWTWVNGITLKEGLVSMSLSGLNDELAISKSVPAQVMLRGKPKKFPTLDQNVKLEPVLKLMGEQRNDIDRPEVSAMLRLLGEWSAGEGRFEHFNPFKSLKEARRKKIGGALLVDAKYKMPSDRSQNWANDHRKQASYEDTLTISCPSTPAGYSIYVCPGLPVSEVPFKKLKIQKEKFDREFALQWNRLRDVDTSSGTFKDRGQAIVVFGKEAIVGWGNSQRNNAYQALIGSIPSEIEKNLIALSLLDVERFPDNDNFFVKNWPMRELIEYVLDVN